MIEKDYEDYIIEISEILEGNELLRKYISESDIEHFIYSDDPSERNIQHVRIALELIDKGLKKNPDSAKYIDFIDIERSDYDDYFVVDIYLKNSLVVSVEGKFVESKYEDEPNEKWEGDYEDIVDLEGFGELKRYVIKEKNSGSYIDDSDYLFYKTARLVNKFNSLEDAEDALDSIKSYYEDKDEENGTDSDYNFEIVEYRY